MLAEAMVDCYNDDERLTGLFTMIEEHLDVPFNTTVLGAEIVVDRLDLAESGIIQAICRRKSIRQRIPLLDLPMPDPRPAGAEWVDAYRRWTAGR